MITPKRIEEPVERYVGPDRDHLAIICIKYLSMVSTMARHYKVFTHDASLEQIYRSIVIPNVMLREEDEELFEYYIEFVGRDMEGSDVDTRRRVACQLRKGIASHNKDKIAPAINSVI